MSELPPEELVQELQDKRTHILNVLHRLDTELVVMKREYEISKEPDTYNRVWKRNLRARIGYTERDRFSLAQSLGDVNKELRAAQHVVHQTQNAIAQTVRRKERSEEFVTCAQEILPPDTWQSIWDAVNERLG